MKFKSLFLTAAVGLLLAGCSSEEPQTGGQGEVPFEGDASMYVSLKFNQGTRAVDYEEGTGDESVIRDVNIYFFDGDKKFVAGQVGLIQKETTSTGNVEKKVKVEVTNDVVKTAKYVLAVINQTKDFTVTEGTSFDTFNAALTIDAEQNSAQGFMMTNSVYGTGTGNVLDTENNLVAITEANWAEKGSADEATVVPVTIYVERVAAKVTLNVADNVATKDAHVSVLGWGLNVMNKSYYPVKKLQGFIDEYATYTDWYGATDLFWNKADDHRSFWGVDPNYDTNFTGQDKNVFFYPTVASMNLKKGDVKYVAENTMKYNQQRVPTTTNAIVFAQYIPDEIVTPADATWYKWNNKNLSPANLINNLFYEFQKKGVTKFYKKDADGKSYKELEEGDFEIAMSAGLPIELNGTKVGHTGRATVVLKNGIAVYTTADGKKFDESTKDAVDAQMLAVVGSNAVETYMNGYCYYEVPIKQFADVVGWDGSADPLTAKHMMRYGVVRNHVYKLTVNSIMNPGKPIDSETITPSDENDDKKEYELSVEINVLSWAVRNQSVDL